MWPADRPALFQARNDLAPSMIHCGRRAERLHGTAAACFTWRSVRALHSQTYTVVVPPCDGIGTAYWLVAKPLPR